MKYLARPHFLFHRYMVRKKAKYPTDEMTLQELFDGLVEANNLTTDYGCHSHMNASNGSSLWTSRIVEYLQEVTDGENVT